MKTQEEILEYLQSQESLSLGPSKLELRKGVYETATCHNMARRRVLF